MRTGHARRSGRRGFTMVELLIVIAIIGVLVSLISAGVWKATVTANRVRNRSEISQLEIAIESFKNKFGIYPPSKILLGETMAAYTPNPKDTPAVAQLKQDSLAALTTIFPRLDFSKSFFIDWDGNGAVTQPLILEGDQCLVFFLGGIPQTDPGGKLFCSGFSTNPVNPTYHVQKPGTDVIGPFFEFDSSRLRKRAPQQSNYFSYLDTYGTVPYVYFSSYKVRNGYNRYGTSDCASLNVWPYAEGASASGLNATWRYWKPNSFQIISAGADGALGRGSDPTIPNSFWTPANAGNSPASAGAGQDDQSNFYDTTLGTPTVTNQ